MSALPLNVFKTKTSILTTATNAVVYTAPVGVTAIILMANIANVSGSNQLVTFSHYRNLPILPDAQGNGAQSANVATELVKNFLIPSDDSANMLSGKMIVENLDSIISYASSPNSCKLVLSILETANA